MNEREKIREENDGNEQIYFNTTTTKTSTHKIMNKLSIAKYEYSKEIG